MPITEIMISRKGPSKFSYPGLKISSSEVRAMAESWIRAERSNISSMPKVEEALTYGAKVNPDQCFRVVREICRRTNEKTLLGKVGVNLLEDLLAYSAHKIKRKLNQELKCNKGLRVAMKSVWLSRRDKGFAVAAPLISRYRNA